MKLRYLLFLSALFITSFLTASPIAVCLSTVYVSLPPDACEITVYGSEINGGSYDTQGVPITLSIDDSNDLGPGTYDFVLTVTSRYGSASCWSQVVVQDKTTPTVTCHNQTHYLVAPDQPIVYNVDDMFTVTDNCDPVEYISISVHDESRFGSSSFTASATDGDGNTGSCSGAVTTIDAEPQNYCSSSRSDYYEHISNVQIGSINQSSGANGGYNWHYPEGSNTIYHGWNYTVSYTPGFRFSTTYQEYWSVYIDKNGDGDFTDSGELLHQWHGYGGNSFTFASPGTYWGWSRIRVVMKYGGYATSPCGGGGYGETEDISVYLRPYFWFPWPGFKQEDLQTELNAAAGQELTPALDRPVEEARPGELAQRRQLTAPEQSTSSNSLAQADISIFPNPVRAGQQVTVRGADATSELQLRNIAGQVIKIYAPGTTQLTMPANLPAGMFLLSGVTAEGGESWTRRVMVR